MEKEIRRFANERSPEKRLVSYSTELILVETFAQLVE